MSHQRSLEARRNEGEDVVQLPIIVGGRPSAGEFGRAPAGLDKFARAAWNEVAAYLIEAKLMDRVDRAVLEGYSVQVGRARALREEIEWEHEPERRDALDGKLLNPRTAGRRVRRRGISEQLRARTTRGTSANPLLAHEREAWKEARLLALDLGLSPVGRAKLVGKGGSSERRGRGLAALEAQLPRRPALTALE